MLLGLDPCWPRSAARPGRDGPWRSDRAGRRQLSRHARAPPDPLPGLSTPRVLQAVLSVFPIDTFIADPCAVMQVVGEPGALPPVVVEMNAALAKHGAKAAVSLERNAFYAAAETAYAIVQTGERRFYGNILLTKGVVAPEEQA